MGSKFTCAKINAKKMILAFGCVDGRCCMTVFEDNYNGLRPASDSNKRLNSKAMKR